VVAHGGLGRQGRELGLRTNDPSRKSNTFLKNQTTINNEQLIINNLADVLSIFQIKEQSK
jgi:hypothetical protein